jgi:hypothetical protein
MSDPDAVLVRAAAGARGGRRVATLPGTGLPAALATAGHVRRSGLEASPARGCGGAARLDFHPDCR